MCVIGHDWESSSSSDGGRWGTEKETQTTDTHTRADTDREWERKANNSHFQYKKKLIKKKKRVVSLNANRLVKQTNAV